MEKIKAIQIDGNNDDILSVTLTDVLQCIKDGKKFTWRILWLDATGDLGNKSILALEEEIKRLENGLLIGWDELLDLSNKFYQVIEIVLIGDQDAKKLKRYDNDEEMYSSCVYTFELLDSSFWLIHSKDADLIANMSSLPGVKQIEPI